MVTQPSRKSAAVLCAASVAFIAFMTLRPSAVYSTGTASCIFCGSLGGVDFVLNTILFVPFGFALRGLTGNWRAPALIGALTTLAIEALQWRVITGRDASLGDLLANTLGTIVGAWLAIEGLRWLNATSVAARRLSVAFGFLAAVLVAGSAWLLQPVQTTEVQWVQFTPLKRNMDLFGGTLHAVYLNGHALPPIAAIHPHQLVDPSDRQMVVRAVVSGPIAPTRRQAVIARIGNDEEEGFALLQWGVSVAFRTHIVAAQFRLRPILVGLENALAGPFVERNGTTGVFTIEGTSNPRAILLGTEPGARGTNVSLRRTVGLAWALIMPWDVALGPHWWPVNAMWLAVLVLPVAFFTLRSARRMPDDSRRKVTWWPLVMVLATLAVVPGLMGLSSLGPGEWSGVLAGIAAGMTTEHWVHSRAPAGLKARV